MSFTQFLTILRTRWKLSAPVFFGTVLTAVVLSLVLPKKYTAEASVVVDVKPDPIRSTMFSAMMNHAILATLGPSQGHECVAQQGYRLDLERQQ